MARFIEWTDDLSVGIEEIDQQHRSLVEIVNDIHEAIAQHKAKEAMDELLQRLEEYTRIHFAVEESLMRIFHYPAYETHQVEHQKLIEQLKDIRTKFAEGHGGVTFELMQVLRNWLVKHIDGSDKAYTSHFLGGRVHAQAQKRSWFARLWSPG